MAMTADITTRYTFIYRFMANHSEENPYGLLSYDVIESWFAMTGGSGNYKANQGKERIPDNWVCSKTLSLFLGFG